jgi:hypothetical protein
MPSDFTPALLKHHLVTCKVCHDPGKDGGDAVFCEEAQLLFRVFRTLLKANCHALAVIH